MKQSVEAVYEDGTLKPLQPMHLREGQHVRIQLDEEADPIELAGCVYDGLSEDEIVAIEGVALDRGGWRRE